MNWWIEKPLALGLQKKGPYKIIKDQYSFDPGNSWYNLFLAF